MHLVTQVGHVSEQSEVRRAYDTAPHVPLVGTPTVSMFNEKAQADLPSSEYLTALHAMDIFPLGTPPFEEPRRGLGRLSQFANCGFRPTPKHPNG